MHYLIKIHYPNKRTIIIHATEENYRDIMDKLEGSENYRVSLTETEAIIINPKQVEFVTSKPTDSAMPMVKEGIRRYGIAMEPILYH